MIAFLRLIRFPNLLIIAFTQYMIRFCLLQPILKLSGFELQMKEWEFALLVLATVFVSAGGYIINDYFDVRIDNINKPDENVIDKEVKRRVAMGAHAVLSVLGVLIGIFLSWKSHILITGGVLFTISVIALWFYSTTFKYKFLTGNLVVSFLTGIVPFMVALFEIPRIILAYNTQLIQQLSKYGFAATTTILLLCGAYGIFAFALSLIREMIKDMEDVEGDKEYGCRTIPIVLGMKKAKLILYPLIILTMAGVAYGQNYLHEQLKDKYSFLYFLILVQIPLLILVFRILKSHEKKQFHFASMLVKFIMLAGICYLFLFRFLLLQ
ncbi:MAG: geranylgeranylglycerol-phosphate geranylgeranyltransferase [Bacteroidetes bacterium]|nr:geranylgeranylglycerol-phosphate geranylgeranyltransferase [Bacteroidota bacterium]